MRSRTSETIRGLPFTFCCCMLEILTTEMVLHQEFNGHQSLSSLVGRHNSPPNPPPPRKRLVPGDSQRIGLRPRSKDRTVTMD
jgi:hypothetical protein